MIKVPFRIARNGTFIMLEKNVIALRNSPYQRRFSRLFKGFQTMLGHVLFVA